MKVKFLPINILNILKRPDRFSIEINKVKLIFEVSWNTEGDFFSFDLFDQDENPLLYGRRITYGVDMLDGVLDDNLPNVKIIPFDKTGQAEQTGITLENFMTAVKPYIVGEE